MPLKRFISLGVLLALLSACGSKATPQPTATRMPPTATRMPPTATRVPPTATRRPADTQSPMGFTAEGWPYRGNPNAEVTLWEFSEFQ